MTGQWCGGRFYAGGYSTPVPRAGIYVRRIGQSLRRMGTANSSQAGQGEAVMLRFKSEEQMRRYGITIDPTDSSRAVPIGQLWRPAGRARACWFRARTDEGTANAGGDSR